ncbi:MULTISPECIES: hypothetical protein [Acidithiobacillus]|jgi:hypothetical protein|uniref:hypothetical protein n=1 Tax=Acidithiobacillus TaxID=119977 RepID=UPI0004E13C96|nr:MULTISPECIES: hypothetical protein [Acidithiobacillus]
MAKVMTFKVLYTDQETENRIIRELKSIEDILDLTVEGINMTNSSLDDSIANETYQKGDAFHFWVICDNNQERYWSDKYGWTDISRATRYASTGAPHTGQPFITSPNACYMLDPARF